MKWALMPLVKYAIFSGRARRREYWSYVLLYSVSLILVIILDTALGTEAFFTLLFLVGTFLPGLAVTVRRLHDLGHSGWYSLMSFAPLLSLALLFIVAREGQPHANRYGPDPKEQASLVEEAVTVDIAT